MDRLPYFDALLSLLQEGDPIARQAFGRHVHWGYWEQAPGTNPPGLDEFSTAAEALAREVYQAAGVKAGHRILDVGCGFGGTVASMNEHLNGLRLTGLNIDFRQLLRAQKQVEARSGNTVGWVQANACALPVANQVLDTILAVECIFHFPQRRKFFKEAFRVLKPGGRLSLSDFLSTPQLRPATWLAARWPTRLGFYGRCDVQFTLEDYRALAAETGFSVAVERDITRNTLPTYDFLRSQWRKTSVISPSAVFETLFVEATSRLGLLRYGILAFEKPYR